MSDEPTVVIVTQGGSATSVGPEESVVFLETPDDVALPAPAATLYTLTVTKSGGGQGRVMGAGLDCGNECSQEYLENAMVTLTATPASGSTFAGWQGACSGTGPCVVTMNADKTVTAVFEVTVDPDPPPPPPDPDPIPPPPGGCDAPAVTPVPGGAVVINVGDSWQAKTNAEPAGTFFLIAVGNHYNQSVVPKPGNKYVGASGGNGVRAWGTKTLNPALATQTSYNGRTWWVWGGQTQNLGAPHPPAHFMLPGHFGDAYNEQLWIDNVLQRRRVTREEVNGPGQWAFHYSANEIWTTTNPAGKPVETSIQNYLFRGDENVHGNTSGVLIENIHCLRYGSPSQRGAIDAVRTKNWRIRFCRAAECHGFGFALGPATEVENCEAHDCGQGTFVGWGSFSRGDPNSFSARSILRNSHWFRSPLLGYHPDFEAGTKFQDYWKGITIENCWAERMFIDALWLDIDNGRDEHCIIRSNLLERAVRYGLHYEISHKARVYWNIIRDVGTGTFGAQQAGDSGIGLFIHSSREVEAFENLIYDNRLLLMCVNDSSRATVFNNQLRRQCMHLNIHHNRIRVGQFFWANGLQGRKSDTRDTQDIFSAAFNNRFQNNLYHVASGHTARKWGWARQMHDIPPWRNYGHDLEGAFVYTNAPPTLPSTSQVLPGTTVRLFCKQHYGPY